MFKQHRMRILNVGLRLASLIAKLGLTLYMGKYLSLSDLGIYGLVFATVMTAGCVMGFRFDYVISREIVDVDIVEVLHKMRDQAMFYFSNYAIATILIVGYFLTGPAHVSGLTLFFIVALTITENFATMTYINLNSLGQQIVANALFFARSGLWAFPIMVMGVIWPSYRSVNVILASWLIGVCICIGFNAYIWRNMPWKKVLDVPVDWKWIGNGLKKSFLIWMGAMGLTVGGYIDRFIVNHFLGIEKAGVVTFYVSFVIALFTLIQSGVLSFSYPRMISLYRERDLPAFWHETRQAFWHVAMFAGFTGAGIGIFVPLLGKLFHRPEFYDEALTLWLLLIGIWIKSMAEVLYYILFARHQDRAIWLGSVLFLIPAFGFDALLVPLIGLPGIGVGSIIAAVFLFGWRWWYVKHFTPDAGASVTDVDPSANEAPEAGGQPA